MLKVFDLKNVVTDLKKLREIYTKHIALYVYVEPCHLSTCFININA